MQTKTSKGLSELSLRVNISWTFVGNAVYAACQWGMLAALTKLGTPEMVGQFSLGLAVTAPILLFSELQLRVVQATDARREYRFGDYLALRIVTTLLALLVVAGVVISMGESLETSLVIVIIGFAKAFEALSDVFYGLVQQHERMDRIAQALMIKGPLSLLMLSAGVFLTGSVVWGVIGLALAWLLVLVGWDIQSGRMILRHRAQKDADEQSEAVQLRPHWEPTTMLRLAWVALPLGFVMMMISLNSNIPRYFIDEYLGKAELGIFSALAYLMVAGHIVIGSLGESASPRLAKYYAAGNVRAFVVLVGKLVAMGGLLGCIAIGGALLLGREVLTLLYSEEYARQSLFVWLMVAAAFSFMASFMGYAITAARYFRAQTVLFASVTGSTALACFWLIPAYELFGAAYALIAASIVQILGSAAVLAYAIYSDQRVATGVEHDPKSEQE